MELNIAEIARSKTRTVEMERGRRREKANEEKWEILNLLSKKIGRPLIGPMI